MTDTEYFSHLYEIASHLNKEFSLHSALRKALEKTVDLLALETGWIWLVQEDVKSVYLAASYNLPPALSEHPERLSGWCFCIETYFAKGITQARNISEITCSRLKNIKSGTRDLKFHATIPITTHGQKVGLINLVSKETQQLNGKQLSILNTISELIGIAIQRTRVQESYREALPTQDKTLHDVLTRVLHPRIDELLQNLQQAQESAGQEEIVQTQERIALLLTQAQALQQQLTLILGESGAYSTDEVTKKKLHYPTSPLTQRELEVLGLVRKGHTNKQIAEQLFIAERTVKFHISSILSKLLARTRTEAVTTALQRGLLSSF
ncbi:MAG: LuxR C-terminal-related transcriptional regulator [Cyclobacteriaceae bacterium]